MTSTRKNPAFHDDIQERCIAAMLRLGMNPNQVADAVADHIARSHVCDFLTRRSGMGSHKLQHLFAVLRLRIAPE